MGVEGELFMGGVGREGGKKGKRALFHVKPM